MIPSYRYAEHLGDAVTRAVDSGPTDSFPHSASNSPTVTTTSCVRSETNDGIIASSTAAEPIDCADSVAPDPEHAGRDDADQIATLKHVAGPIGVASWGDAQVVSMTRVLLTGADGYMGIGMGDHLIRSGFDVVGLDSGFHRVGWLYNSTALRPPMITKDTRQIEPADLDGFDAVVHLAEISNDPVGEFSQDVTYSVNHRGSVRLAELARAAGVQRFVHMSSCSVYGASGDRSSREDDPTDPLTAYAKCKVLVEQHVGALADETFSPTFLRNSTVYGASPRQRFDLVVNDLAASAFLYHEIRMSSDGTPWRPFVHLLDVAKAVECVLRAPKEAIHGEVFNVGAAQANYQIRQIAEIIGSLVPGCAVQFGEPGADQRNYRADFNKISTQLPGFACDWDVERGAADLLAIMERVGMDEDQYRFRGYTRLAQIRHLLDTAQIDEQFMWTTQ